MLTRHSIAVGMLLRTNEGNIKLSLPKIESKSYMGLGPYIWCDEGDFLIVSHVALDYIPDTPHSPPELPYVSLLHLSSGRIGHFYLHPFPSTFENDFLHFDFVDFDT